MLCWELSLWARKVCVLCLGAVTVGLEGMCDVLRLVTERLEGVFAVLGAVTAGLQGVCSV